MYKWRIDPWLLLTYLFSASLSLVVLTSIVPSHVYQQAIMFGIALVIFIYLSSQDNAVFKTFAPFAYLLSLLLLLITYFFGSSVRGSLRWIAIGSFQLQASEVVKPFLVLAFAFFLKQFPIKTFKNILINFLLFSLPTFLIFKQPDLGTALSVSMIWITQLFVSGLSYFMIGGGLVTCGFFLEYLPKILHDYQLKRIRTFIDPFSDPLGSGYNVIQSIIAVGSGGFWGRGLGHGTQSHLRFLPERHTDFVFASLAEELGIIGSFLVLACLAGLLYRLLDLATHTKSASSRLIYLGTFGYLAFQTFVNIGMNIGLTPVTGVTLPLISYGGSSILSIAISLGIASSCAKADQHTRLIEIK